MDIKNNESKVPGDMNISISMSNNYNGSANDKCKPVIE